MLRHTSLLLVAAGLMATATWLPSTAADAIYIIESEVSNEDTGSTTVFTFTSTSRDANPTTTAAAYEPQYDDQVSTDDSGNVIIKPWINVSHVETNCSYLIPVSETEDDAMCITINSTDIDISQYVCEYGVDGVLECVDYASLQTDCPLLVDKSSLNKSTHLKSAARLSAHTSNGIVVTMASVFTLLVVSLAIA